MGGGRIKRWSITTADLPMRSYLVGPEFKSTMLHAMLYFYCSFYWVWLVRFYLFSKIPTSSNITKKKLWLYEVSLTRKEYVDPDNANMRQAISQHNQMQSFLITNGPLLHIIPRKRPVASQNNRILDEEQHAAAIIFLDHQQSVLKLHPLWLLLIISYNKPCSPSSNPL